MKHRKRILSALLAAVMVMTALTGCGGKKETAAETPEIEAAEKGEEFDWLDTSGNLPLVAEGTEKTLRIYTYMQPDAGQLEDLWLYNFIQDKMNINLEITSFSAENREEFLSLAFASDDLPDIIIEGNFTASDLSYYGASEGQLLDLAPYVNDTFMPNLTKIYEAYPDFKESVQDTEGHIWSLGYFSNPENRNNVSRAFINYDWLEKCGLEVPTTLDEFVDMLYKFKELDESDYPLGGTYAYKAPTNYLLNAFGYNTNDYYGTVMALRNGTPVLPVADREAYGEFLKLMNQLYTDGILHPDYFTLDKAGAKAVYANAGYGFLSEASFLYVSDFQPYWGALPLTSEWNDTAFWPANYKIGVSAGQALVTSACEEPELAVAFLDWFYTKDNFELSTRGPKAEQTDLLDDSSKGWYLSEDGAVIQNSYEENKDAYASENDYVYKNIQIWDARIIGTEMEVENLKGNVVFDYEPNVADYEDINVLRKEITSGQLHWQKGLESTVCNYVTEERFPDYVYIDPDDATYYDNLLTVIDEYATQESAKFITGARSLDELDAYFDEIERLGALEYVEFFTEYYNSIH